MPWSTDLLRGVVTLEENNLVLLYYLSASEIWPDKMRGLWWAWSYIGGHCCSILLWTRHSQLRYTLKCFNSLMNHLIMFCRQYIYTEIFHLKSTIIVCWWYSYTGIFLFLSYFFSKLVSLITCGCFPLLSDLFCFNINTTYIFWIYIYICCLNFRRAVSHHLI